MTAWLGLLWWMMVCWAQARVSRPWFLGVLAFVAGLSVLVRPELALIGGLALVMLLLATPGRRDRLMILVAGGLLPVGYQIFRMGYYGLVVPQTALAKDASGSKWGQGLIYLSNFTAPYALWVPAVLLIALGWVLRVGCYRVGDHCVGWCWAGVPDRVAASKHHCANPGWPVGYRARWLSLSSCLSAGWYKPCTGFGRVAISCTAESC